MKRILTCTLECVATLSLAVGLGCCSRYNDDVSPAVESRFTLSFDKNAAGLTDEQIETVYSSMRFVAYTDATNQNVVNGYFSHAVLLRQRDDVVYEGTMRVGKDWGIVAVTPGNTLPLPGAGAEMATTAMYTMPDDAETCPELFFNCVRLPEIERDQNYNIPMSLARNMSQVYVRIADKHGIVQDASEAIISLHDVPTTISWTGTILPDVENPNVRPEDKPITFTIPTDEAWTTHTDGYKVSSDDHFTVIPAHRGSDFWNADGTMNKNPIDSLKHTMKISLTYVDKYGANIAVSPKAVKKVPVCNGRIIYNLIPSPTNADVEIEVELLPWNVEDSQIEIEARRLTTSNCVTVSPGQQIDIPLEDVFQAWNWEHNEQLGDKMDQTQMPVAEVVSGNDLISADVIYPMSGELVGSLCSIRVKTLQVGVTGEATVGLKLPGDAGYRWLWHVHITSDSQALGNGHCSWTAEFDDVATVWGMAMPESDKSFVVGVTQTGSPVYYSPAQLVTLTTGPGALPYKVTFVDKDKNPAPDAVSLFLWNMEQQDAGGSEVYVVPTHDTPICMNVKDAALFATGGYLKIEQCNFDGTFVGEQYVQVGIASGTVAKTSAPYAGQNGLTMALPSTLSVRYPDNSTGSVASIWNAETCDENGVPAKSNWVSLTKFENLGAGASVEMDISAQQSSNMPLLPAVSNYDLSTKGGTEAMNTANCYIVHAPGTYSLPLVYGNAIKDGNINSSAYTTATGILRTFLNHNNVGISDPYIYNNSINIGSAKLLWQDLDGMIDEDSVATDADGKTLTFRVTDKIDYGNAVLAVFDTAGNIAWSWHIWSTDYDPDAADGTKTVTNRISPNTSFNFMTQNIGWCPGATYAARSQHLLLSDQTTGAAVVVVVDQESGTSSGNNPYFQWGRKDPMPGILSGNVNKPTYGPAEYIWPSTGGNPGTQLVGGQSIPDYIKNPYKFCSNQTMDSTYYNLWSANNTVTTVNTNIPVKTVYDPSPVGFVLPPSGAFTGFTSTGSSGATMNVAGTFDSGWNFYCGLTGPGDTIFFPASGFRNYSTGAANYVGAYGYYWSSGPFSTTGGRYLYFYRSYVYPQNYTNRGYGFPARAVQEF